MIALAAVTAILAVLVVARVAVLMARTARGEHVSDQWRDEHVRERRDDDA